MKFDCGETSEEYTTRMETWRPFFAVLPRQVGPHDCRWLEWIERRFHMGLVASRGGMRIGWRAQYRARPA